MQIRVYQRRRKVGGVSRSDKIWSYEVKWRSARTGESCSDSGSTGCHTRKDADAWVIRKACELERRDRLGEPLGGSMTLADACARWFEEIGAATKTAFDYERDLADLCRLIGEDKLLRQIDSNVVLAAARLRAAEPKRIYLGKDKMTGERRYRAGALPSPATINRQVIEPLKRILLRARDVWHQPVDRMPDWKKIRKPEPEGRSREAMGGEAVRYLDALPASYRPFALFYAGSGRRIREVLNMRPETVNLAARTYTYKAKHRRQNVIKTATLTGAEVAIVATEVSKAPKGFIWSYEVAHGAKKGERRPITYAGFRRVEETAKRKAGITDFRRHDWRHDALTKLVRETGDLTMAKETAGHADIASTMRYLHATTGDVRAARERVAAVHIQSTAKAVNE